MLIRKSATVDRRSIFREIDGSIFGSKEGSDILMMNNMREHLVYLIMRIV